MNPTDQQQQARKRAADEQLTDRVAARITDAIPDMPCLIENLGITLRRGWEIEQSPASSDRWGYATEVVATGTTVESLFDTLQGEVEGNINVDMSRHLAHTIATMATEETAA